MLMSNQNIPMGYPYPDTKGPIHEFDVEEYDRARLVWRMNLSDSLVRSFASDYRMGKHTEDNYDGYQEFLDRGLDERDANARLRKPAPTRKRRKT